MPYHVHLLLLALCLPALALPSRPALPIPQRSTLSEMSCLPQPPFTPHWTIEEDPHRCLAFCGSLSPDFSAIIRARSTVGSGVAPDPLGSTEYDCLCADTAPFDMAPFEPDLPACGQRRWIVYTPTLPWDARDLPQREYQHALDADRAQRAYQALKVPDKRLRKRPSLAACPDGFHVCLPAVEGASFECVDVRSSLTSCGACVYGEALHDGSSSRLGNDCTSLPGVSDGGVQCKAGSCIATSCLEGFVLSDDRCIRA